MKRMRRLLPWACVLSVGLLLASRILAAEPDLRAAKDVAYRVGKTDPERNTLDVYTLPAADAEKGKAPAQTGAAAAPLKPVMVWLHGGGWRMGDKTYVQNKPAAFCKAGYVFVSTNYRFHPKVGYAEQGADVAGAIRWVREHIQEYGGDPERIFLAGHSAGAHLSALVGIDDRYLKGEKLDLSALKGVVLVDGAGYDVAKQTADAPMEMLRTLYTDVFGTDPAKQKDASPRWHVAPGKKIPPFLILHVARRADAKSQAEGLSQALTEAGVSAKVVPAQGKSHRTINHELGDAGDAPTEAMFEFLTPLAFPKPAAAAK